MGGRTIDRNLRLAGSGVHSRGHPTNTLSAASLSRNSALPSHKRDLILSAAEIRPRRGRNALSSWTEPRRRLRDGLRASRTAAGIRGCTGTVEEALGPAAGWSPGCALHVGKLAALSLRRKARNTLAGKIQRLSMMRRWRVCVLPTCLMHLDRQEPRFASVAAEANFALPPPAELTRMPVPTLLPGGCRP